MFVRYGGAIAVALAGVWGTHATVSLMGGYFLSFGILAAVLVGLFAGIGPALVAVAVTEIGYLLTVFPPIGLPWAEDARSWARLGGHALTAIAAAVAAGWARDARARAWWLASEARRGLAASRQVRATQERLVAVVAHDLRTPIAAIQLAADLLERSPEPRTVAAVAPRIRSSSGRMDEIVTHLLDFALVQAHGGIPVELRAMRLDEVSARIAREAEAAHPGKRVNVEAEGACWVRGDPARLEQAVSNLLVNALQHGDGDAELTVAARDGLVRLGVRNRGMPIPPDLLPVLFEPFRRGDDGVGDRAHLGLGLYIVREIVRAHGGTVEVRSDAEAGTRFEVRLPATTPGDRPPEAARAAEGARGSPSRA